ncbi:MAG TPA: hypothetical protein VIM57_09975 [Luteolibacter sp.]
MKPKNWRKCPLTVGGVYKALKDLPSLLEPIQTGAYLEFERMEYSPYDGMSIVIFQTVQDSHHSPIRWTLLDDSPDPEWDSLFVQIPPTPDSPPSASLTDP